jgi:hypothetical protein
MILHIASFRPNIFECFINYFYFMMVYHFKSFLVAHTDNYAKTFTLISSAFCMARHKSY